MSLPRRPDDSSRGSRDNRHVFRESSSRRRRTSDLENTRTHDRSNSKSGANEYARALPSPGTPVPMERDPIMRSANTTPAHELGRKRSLIRPERQRMDPSHPNYHYSKHAQRMAVKPSTTGNDPIIEDSLENETVSSDSTDLKPSHLRNASGGGYHDKQAPLDDEKLQRRMTRSKTAEAREIQRQKEKDKLRPPSFWNVYCAIITFWCPDALLRCFGKPAKAQQRAWREKVGLVSIIMMICTFVGYLTFGFTETVCPSGGNARMRVNKVDNGTLIVHGKAYNLAQSKHPPARGIPSGANVLFDLPEKHGGQDASFLFQNVNGACKGLITPKENSGIPTSGNSMAWYFPCRFFNQDGSSKPNTTFLEYNGYMCHTSDPARKAFNSLQDAGDVFFTWDDIRNSSRNLMVWGGDVLDLNLLDHFNRTQVNIPPIFDQIKVNPAVRGVDVTRTYSSSYEKQVARCFTEIIKVGSIDTESIGCIASKVVLYVSLVFILAVVVAKFILALAFQWFISKQFGATKTSVGKADSKQRKQQIEEWSDDIYRPPPKLSDASGGPDRSSKRGSTFLPSTSRFTSPYSVDKSTKTRAAPTTMTSQSTNSRGLSSSAGVYRQLNNSHGTLPTYDGKHSMQQSVQESRTSLLIPGSTDNRYSGMMSEEGPGPAGFIHEAVVPQPPPEWQPFGYPLAHSICLVTAYSEGADGIRTTIDSIATTDYPNSHKLILVICDGIIKGKGEDLSTPEICLAMMKDHAVLPHEVQAFSYVAVASGSKRHNMAKIYSGFYDYGEDSRIPVDKQQRVPMMVVVKCGTPDEAHKSKPGNRGKRDSQIILMSFLQKVMFDERMTELEFEMFNGIWKITGISPDFYEIVLMVDADTKVFPDSLTHMISAMVKDPDIMGLCGETKIANKRDSWVSMIQVFEYFISHHLAKSFESVFGGVTCLPGCFCMYRIKAPKGGQNYWVPILANPDVVEHYSENVVDTLHKKNLLLLGEDRYLSTLMLKTFPKRKQVFVPQAVCKTTVPDEFKVLLSQRRRWINSTIHNLMELVLVRDLCGTFCFSMQFVVFIELIGTLVLPAAIAFTFYLIAISIKAAVLNTAAPVIPLILLAMILGLPAILIVVTAHRWSYVAWMFVYLLSLPIWNFVLPTYAFWKFDDFSWGDTRKTAGEKTKKAGLEYEGEFDSSKITMRRWHDFEAERRLKAPGGAYSQQQQQQPSSTGGWPQQQQGYDPYYDN
ncbi:chitin synthase [Parastagonospora nodorum]|nr:chitin synthase [Parastagonospora nodorum]KAH3989685.1 chitin synthase [Parastagonospora nodorum]KAH4034258.1 chitin synthase [Parastagonospora nodorum]KAH4076433.1 chitin synthase [Parastagonospora nodorum]KAH4096087.1 chitin synthase [Parastagonospora nodorum]